MNRLGKWLHDLLGRIIDDQQRIALERIDVSESSQKIPDDRFGFEHKHQARTAAGERTD